MYCDNQRKPLPYPCFLTMEHIKTSNGRVPAPRITGGDGIVVVDEDDEEVVVVVVSVEVGAEEEEEEEVEVEVVVPGIGVSAADAVVVVVVVVPPEDSPLTFPVVQPRTPSASMS